MKLLRGLAEKVKAMPRKKLIIIGIAVLAILITVIAVSANKGKNNNMQAVETDVVIRGNIEETITGSATIEPYERYEIIALVSGDILSAPFEVGDEVKEGDLLYEFDKTTASLSIERQELNLEQSKNNYDNALEEAEKLTVTAPCSGVVSGVTAKKGKEVQNSTVLAKVENTYDLEVKLPFNASQARLISVGDIATISSSIHMSRIDGTVTHVEANPTAQADGAMLCNVTIKLTNPGGLTAGTTVGGEVNGMISPGSGVLENGDNQDIKAEVSGEISNVYVSNGDYVTEGQALFTIESDSVTNSIKSSSLSYRSSSLSLQESKKSLEDYSITSPINGTVITKNSKAGDTIDRNSNSQTLMVVADISKLKFTLNIDELDISKVEVGQEVKISCDALSGEEYFGEITNVSVEGTSTNGVTVYEAEVVVNEPGNLRPSMNIDATVVLASSENTLMVPSSDVKTVMGRSYVFIKSDSKKSEQTDNAEDFPQGSGKDNDEEMPVVGIERGERPEGSDNGSNNGKMPQAPTGNGEGNSGRKSMTPEAPEGYETVFVETGLSNDEYTEILSGLEEGEEIYRMSTSTTSNRGFYMGGMGSMGGMSGAPDGMGGNMGGGPGSMGGGR